MEASISAEATRQDPPRVAARDFALGCLVLAVLDVVFLRFVILHFEHWGFWDWDYQQTLFEVARSSLLEFHQLPLWNAHIGGGVTLAGNTLNHVWAPCFIPILLFGTIAGIKLCIPIYLGLAQFGLWRLARQRGLAPSAAFLATILFSLGGVYAQRLTHGHFEWIAIAWMPHVLVYVHRARAGHFTRPLWLGAIAMAFIFLDGGPYQFAFFMVFAGAYASALCLEERSTWPLFGLAAIAVLGACLAAIKLVPVAEMVSGFPRPPTAPNNFYGAPFTLSAFELLEQMFVSRAQGHDAARWMPLVLNVGCYVGWIPLLLAGYATVRGFRRNAIWAGLGLLFLWIALGPAAPIDLWALLHELPLLGSLRVPSRFNVFVLIILALLAGEGLQFLQFSFQRRAGRFVAPKVLRRWPEGVVFGVILFVAVDLVAVNGEIFRVAFSVPAFEVERQDEFAHYRDSPYLERYRETALVETFGNWVSGAFPAVLENRGVIRTYRTVGTGGEAIAFDAGLYRGEVWMEGAPAAAIISTDLTPNRLLAETDGRAGIVVFNFNHDPGWKLIDGEAAEIVRVRGHLGVRVPAGVNTVVLAYQPTAFLAGASLSLLTVGAGWVVFFRARRAKRARERLRPHSDSAASP